VESVLQQDRRLDREVGNKGMTRPTPPPFSTQQTGATVIGRPISRSVTDIHLHIAVSFLLYNDLGWL